MKASELRIGNLVEYAINDTFKDRKPYYGKCVFQVVTILNDSIKIDLGHEAIQRVLFDDPKLKPIPLTEEWVVKFGGIKRPNGIKHIDIGDFTLLETEGGFIVWHKGHSLGRIFKHVYQLQNLYFALTGEELKIKQQ
jgi:hypothetical protein